MCWLVTCLHTSSSLPNINPVTGHRSQRTGSVAEIRDVSLRFSSLEQKVEIKDEENISDPFIVNVDNLPTEKDKEQFLLF